MSRYGDKHVIARGVILWDGVTRPEQKEDAGNRYMQYSLKVALLASQPEVQEINQIATLALNESKWKGAMPPGGSWPLLPIAATEFEGRLPNHVAFNAKSRRCPQVFDINKQELAPMMYSQLLYPGCIVDVLMSTYAFDKKSKGIAASLDGIMIIDATAPRLPVGVQVDAGAAFGGGGGPQAATPPPVYPQGGPTPPPVYQPPPQQPVYTPPPAQYNPAGVQPAPDFLNPPGGAAGGVPGGLPAGPPPAAPPAPAPPPAAPVHAMTAKAAGQTYEAFRRAGWTDQQLIDNGYMS